MRRAGLLVAALYGLLPHWAGAHDAWVDAPGAAQRLASGQIIERASHDGADAHIEAAILIDAPPRAIFGALKDCAHAPAFIPGLKGCQLLAAAPDGSWQIVKHVVKYSWLMPAVVSIYRAEYHEPGRIDFHRVGGDLKSEYGTWSLESSGAATLVEYEVFVDPGFWIPRPVIRHALRKELPAMLAALRNRVEQLIAPRERPVAAAR
ncbi:MAG TPA: SRPBCC family protein [Steroidobacteraceae bacterium]|nr:SRPBCC family protein [Steroidobacteraceae bacterium]